MNGKQWSNFLIVAAMVLGVTALAAPKDIYVATNATPSSPYGNWSDAFTSIQDAIDHAGNGDTIHLAGHTFALTSQLAGLAGKSDIIIRGGYAATDASPGAWDPQSFPTRIQRESGSYTRLIYVSNATNITIEGIEFRGGYLTNNYGGGIYAANVTNLTITGCKLISNQARHSSNVGGGALYANNVTGLVSNTLMIANSSQGYGTLGGAVYLLGTAGDLVFRDVIMAGNRVTNLSNGSSRGGAVYIAAGKCLFENVLFLSNAAATEGGAIHREAGTMTLYNATITGSAPDGIRGAGTVRDSIFFGNVRDLNATGPTLHTSLTDEDPLFEWPLVYLKTGSPALGAGGRTAAAAGLAAHTVFTNSATYAGGGDTVHLGFHYRAGLPAMDVELHVNPDPLVGDDGNPGTAASPLRTLTRAIELVGNWQTARVFLAPGAYTNNAETFPLAITERTIQFVGTNAETTIISAAGSSQRVFRFTRTIGHNLIKGVTIREASIDTGGAGINAQYAVLSLEDCIVRDNYTYRTDGVSQGAGLYAAYSAGVVRNCLFYYNLSRGRNGLTGGGAYLSYGDWLVKNTHFDNNRTVAIPNYASQEGGGLVLDRASARLRNNLFIRNQGAANGSALVASAARLAIENCTVSTNAGNAANAFYFTGGSASVRNSIFWNNSNSADFNLAIGNFTYSLATALTSGDGNKTSDPLFVAGSSGILNFRLQPTSHCVDAGTNQAWMVGATDLDKTDRIQGPKPKRVDMGAYELAYSMGGSIFMFR